MGEEPPNNPLPLSVAIVCRNSERTIVRTLDSVRALATEIVAVDSGSTDRTLAILREHNARIIEHEWLGFRRTKQLALEACAQPWVLNLDSDESLEPALAQSIRDALSVSEAGVDGYMLNRKIYWSGVWLHHAWQPEWRLRLVRRGVFHWGGYDPHNALVPVRESARPRIGRLPGDLRHESFATMADHLAAQARYAHLAAASYVALGRRTNAWKMTFNPCAAFLKQVVLRQAFRDGWRGWAAAGSVAAATLMKHIVLMERQRTRDERDDS